MQSSKLTQTYASSLQKQKMEEIGPLLFKNLLQYFSTEQVTYLNRNKITRVCLGKIDETSENKLNLHIAKLIASLYQLKCLYNKKFSFQYLTTLEYFITKRNWGSSPDFGYQHPIPVKGCPSFLIDDWNNLEKLDKQKLKTVLKMEFASHYIIDFSTLGPVSLPTVLFEPYCLSLKSNIVKNYHHIFVRDDQQLLIICECLKSSRDCFYHISLYIETAVSVAAIRSFKQNLLETKNLPFIFFSCPTAEVREALRDLLDSFKANKQFRGD